MDEKDIPPKVADVFAMALNQHVPGLTGSDLIQALLGHLNGPAENPPPLQFLSVLKVADIFDVSRDTIMRWVRSGKLEAAKFGGQWRIPGEAVKRFAREQGLTL